MRRAVGRAERQSRADERSMSSWYTKHSTSSQRAQENVQAAISGDQDSPFESEAWRGPRTQKLSTLTRYAVLSISDITALTLSFLCGYLAWSHLVLDQPLSTYVDIVPLLWLFPISYAVVGLYPGFGLGVVESLRRLFYSTSLAFLVLAAASFAFKADPRYSRMTFAITWIIALAIVPLMRSLTLSVAKRFHWWLEPTVVFGTLPQIELTIRSVSSVDSLGYQIVGALCQDERMFGRCVQGVRILGGLDLGHELTRRGVTTMLAWDSPAVTAELADLQEQIYHMLFVREEGRLPVERVQMRNLGGVLGIEFTNELLRRDNQIIKRLLDLVVGATCLLIAAPIIALCGVLVKIASPGPIFFRQQREGLNGRRFTVWKLRTMRLDAEVRLAEVLSRDPILLKEWQQSVKLSRDPRLIPVVGKWLRRFSLDELPQLWNVILGDMSLVGPRPFPEYHLRILSPEFKRFRSRVRPGLTGMWQVAVRSKGTVAEQERFDKYYIRNWSIWLDVYLMARTVRAVLTGRGAC
jgi:Undecaprenyl-phosphate galactose phosphotransferase WbaP